MKEKMERFIKEKYPKAILDDYIESRWGNEYLFYPTPTADEPYTCIVKAGKLTILTEF